MCLTSESKSKVRNSAEPKRARGGMFGVQARCSAIGRLFFEHNFTVCANLSPTPWNTGCMQCSWRFIQYLLISEVQRQNATEYQVEIFARKYRVKKSVQAKNRKHSSFGCICIVIACFYVKDENAEQCVAPAERTAYATTSTHCDRLGPPAHSCDRSDVTRKFSSDNATRLFDQTKKHEDDFCTMKDLSLILRSIFSHSLTHGGSEQCICFTRLHSHADNASLNMSPQKPQVEQIMRNLTRLVTEFLQLLDLNCCIANKRTATFHTNPTFNENLWQRCSPTANQKCR